jgi:hypothetical protein
MAMKMLPKLLFTVALVASCYGSIEAQEPSHMHAAKTDHWRNNLWPMPFRAEDSIAVTNVFDIQRNNGWRLYNTLGTPMFDPVTNRLTDAGRAHLRWIMTYAPQSRRVVFVLKGDDAAKTAHRVESTQLAISELVPVGSLPPIYLTDVESMGSSGVYQTAVYRAMVSSVPSPRLPVASGGDAP